MANLPKHSIAAKLYVIFALLATVTLVLAAQATINARNRAAMTDEFGAAFRAAHNFEEINGLIYAIGLESRGIYLSSDLAEAKPFAESLLKYDDRLNAAMKRWQQSVAPEDRDRYRDFATRMQKYHEFRRANSDLTAAHGWSATRSTTIWKSLREFIRSARKASMKISLAAPNSWLG